MDNPFSGSKSNEQIDSCSRCGSNELKMVKHQDLNNKGGFKETWKCDSCLKYGTIKGDKRDAPDTWKYTGVVFS